MDRLGIVSFWDRMDKNEFSRNAIKIGYSKIRSFGWWFPSCSKNANSFYQKAEISCFVRQDFSSGSFSSVMMIFRRLWRREFVRSGLSVKMFCRKKFWYQKNWNWKVLKRFMPLDLVSVGCRFADLSWFWLSRGLNLCAAKYWRHRIAACCQSFWKIKMLRLKSLICAWCRWDCATGRYGGCDLWSGVHRCDFGCEWVKWSWKLFFQPVGLIQGLGIDAQRQEILDRLILRINGVCKLKSKYIMFHAPVGGSGWFMRCFARFGCSDYFGIAGAWW